MQVTVKFQSTGVHDSILESKALLYWAEVFLIALNLQLMDCLSTAAEVVVRSFCINGPSSDCGAASRSRACMSFFAKPILSVVYSQSTWRKWWSD